MYEKKLLCIENEIFYFYYGILQFIEGATLSLDNGSKCFRCSADIRLLEAGATYPLNYDWAVRRGRWLGEL